MTAITFKWDGAAIVRMQEALSKLSGRNFDDAGRRALNHTGDKARTVVKRTLAKQVGVTQADLVKYGALEIKRASYGRLSYEMGTTGRHIPLKAFGARQTRKGVSAAPWGKRRTFPHTFAVSSMDGHVFKRVGSGRFPIKKLWGPNVAAEMLKKPTRTAWEGVAKDLPARVEHEVRVITSGIVS